ncbi:hypothetical protein D9615_005800 [Tricholomella constricta]|uniref:Uncharacterized protein n=1 Tax=Tricholomella constricta TaxID=117010 RepID=A0A8H5HAL5_9AGAR|nr:hypothetical protein D9615_005800 [Tricholomella constricta]
MSHEINAYPRVIRLDSEDTVRCAGSISEDDFMSPATETTYTDEEEEEEREEYDTELERSLSLWSFSSATLRKSKLVTDLYPQPLPAHADVVLSTCNSTPHTGMIPPIDGGGCLYGSAQRLEAKFHPKSKPWYRQFKERRVVQRIRLLSPLPTAVHGVAFKPTDPCPKSLGVTLRDILDWNEVCIRDSGERLGVMHRLASPPLLSINIVVKFMDEKSIKYPVIVGCDCGAITRAKLAWEIALAVYAYHKVVFQL